MLKFYETPCDTIFHRTFTLEENSKRIGGAALCYEMGATIEFCAIVVQDWQLDKDKDGYADLLAGALLNAACNTEVALIRVPKGEQWSRFGLVDKGDVLEQTREQIVFDSVCASRNHCTECVKSCENRGAKE